MLTSGPPNMPLCSTSGNRFVIRSILFSALVAAVPLGGAGAAEPIKPIKPINQRAAVQCEAQASPGDLRNIACPLKASTTPRRYRFKADFSGGHDDTMASMALSLDGAPLACDEGSKTSLMGEDGDVSLECRFSVPQAAGAPVLKVVVKWSHAQYTDAGLVALE